MLSNKKRVILNFIKCAVFTAIAISIFFLLTYLFRGDKGILNIVYGFKNQANKIDAVLFGPSTVYNGFDPLQAYNSFGFTSYDYAVPGGEFDALQFMAEESKNTNDAELYLFDLRSIAFDFPIENEEYRLRSFTDALPLLSPVRLKAITSFLSNRDWPKEVDILSYYLDISKYHTEYANVLNPANWKGLYKKDLDNLWKGYENSDRNHTVFKKSDVSKGSSPNMPERKERALLNLLDYCDKENLNAVFYCPPFIPNSKNADVINKAAEIIKDRGYDFIDFTKYYDEIGIDFATDYSDGDHLNYLGTKKFTDYFGKILSKDYNLPDHRNDPNYIEWNNDYEKSINNRLQKEEKIYNIIKTHLENRKIAEGLPQTKNFNDWQTLIDNNYFTVIIKTKGALTQSLSNTGWTRFVKRYDIDLSKDNFATVWTGDEKLLAIETDTPKDIEVGAHTAGFNDRLDIGIGSGDRLQIGNIDYNANKNGVQVVIYDNIYRDVVDNTMLTQKPDGSIELDRQGLI